MRVLVTGGAGFIGSNLANRLDEEGHDVTVIDNGSNGNFKRLNPTIKIIESDILDVHNYINFDYIYHCACVNIRSLESSTEEQLKVNALSTLRILEAIKNSKQLKRFVYVSSCSVYGNNLGKSDEDTRIELLSHYAATKQLGEVYCKLYDVPFTILRLSNVYGDNQDLSVGAVGVIGKFINEIKQKGEISIIGTGNQTRDFTYIDDVVDAIILASRSNMSQGETYNVSSNFCYSINEVLAFLKKYADFDVHHIDKTEVDNIEHRLIDNTKIRNHLGWTPKTNLAKGIERVWK